MVYDNFEDFDSKIGSEDDILGSDVKINPDFYIHNALLKAQKCLSDDNLKEGFLKYRIFVEMIENLCDAAGMIDKKSDENYYKLIEKFEKELDEKKLNDDVRSIRLSHYKLKLLMSDVFKRKTITGSLKDNSSKNIDSD